MFLAQASLCGNHSIRFVCFNYFFTTFWCYVFKYKLNIWIYDWLKIMYTLSMLRIQSRFFSSSSRYRVLKSWHYTTLQPRCGYLPVAGHKERNRYKRVINVFYQTFNLKLFWSKNQNQLCFPSGIYSMPRNKKITHRDWGRLYQCQFLCFLLL